MKHSTLSMLFFAILFTFALSVNTKVNCDACVEDMKETSFCECFLQPDALCNLPPSCGDDLGEGQCNDAVLQECMSGNGGASFGDQPPLCNMDLLESKAEETPGCADALSDDFSNNMSKCACWTALGEQFRNENFNCLTDPQEDATIMENYMFDCLGGEGNSTLAEVEQCPEEKSCQDGTKISCSDTVNGCVCEVCPIKKVIFEFEASITTAQFNAQKVNITVEMAWLLAARRDYVKLIARTSPNEGVFRVEVKAQNKSQATEIGNQVWQANFTLDLGDSLTDIIGSKVTVYKLTKFIQMDINVETPKDSDKEQCPEVQTCDDGTKISCSGTDGDCDCEVCPTKEVKFEFQADITTDQFIAQKANMTAEMANLLAVRKDYVKLDLKENDPKGNATVRRTLNEGVYIYVTVKAENEAQATAITKQVRQEDFKTKLEDSLTRATGSKVTVERVSQPTTTSINVETAKASEESKNNTVIIVVVVLSVLAVLGVTGALAYYHYFLADGFFFNQKDGVVGDLECANDLECTNDCDLKAAIESLDL